MLYKALRERGLMAERQYEDSKGGELDLALFCELGKLGISLGEPETRRLRESRGWHYLMIPESALNSDLPGVLHTIEATVQRLGGLATEEQK